MLSVRCCLEGCLNMILVALLPLGCRLYCIVVVQIVVVGAIPFGVLCCRLAGLGKEIEHCRLQGVDVVFFVSLGFPGSWGYVCLQESGIWCIPKESLCSFVMSCDVMLWLIRLRCSSCMVFVDCKAISDSNSLRWLCCDPKHGHCCNVLWSVVNCNQSQSVSLW